MAQSIDDEKWSGTGFLGKLEVIRNGLSRASCQRSARVIVMAKYEGNRDGEV